MQLLLYTALMKLRDGVFATVAGAVVLTGGANAADVIPEDSASFTFDEITVTGKCLKAIARNSILHNSRRPAGQAKLQKDTLKIAIYNNAFPDKFALDYSKKHFSRAGMEPSYFPEDVKKHIIDGLRYWGFKGKIEFVLPHQENDFSFIPYNYHISSEDITKKDLRLEGAYAEFPQHTNLNIKHKGVSGSQILGFNMRNVDNVRDTSKLRANIKHEFGHAFGILHTETGFNIAERRGACTSRELSATMQSAVSGWSALMPANHGRLLDPIIREYLRGSSQPNKPVIQDGPDRI